MPNENAKTCPLNIIGCDYVDERCQCGFTDGEDTSGVMFVGAELAERAESYDWVDLRVVICWRIVGKNWFAFMNKSVGIKFDAE